jgi:hypothetical protein
MNMITYLAFAAAVDVALTCQLLAPPSLVTTSTQPSLW